MMPRIMAALFAIIPSMLVLGLVDITFSGALALQGVVAACAATAGWFHPELQAMFRRLVQDDGRRGSQRSGHGRGRGGKRWRA